MEQFKTVLAEGTQGGQSAPVVTAKNINMVFQAIGGPISTSSNALSDGNFDITADLEMVLANGQTVTSKMTTISRKLAEMETVIANMKNNDPEKAKMEAEFQMWKTMIEEIQAAIAKGLKSDYELKNPVQ